MVRFLTRTHAYLASKRFYYLVLVLFVVEAVWIAFSAAYPQAFDENFHFGIIKVYSHYWLPFLTSQPPHAAQYGALARDPSYLYQYLMSYPYRLISLFTHTQDVQVVILRLINIALFSWGIVLFRKILVKSGCSAAMSNLIMLLFIFVPIVPQLAAQINYDNLMIPLTAASILLAFRITDQLRENRPSLSLILGYLSLGLLTTLVKYAFAPIFLGEFLFLAVVLIRNYRQGRLGELKNQLSNNFKATPKWLLLALSVLFIVSLCMFMQRDGVNIIKYHEVAPDCAKVLPIASCKHYSPWAYNYKKHNKLVSEQSPFKYTNAIVYPFQWLYWMWYRLFFAVNGPSSSFENYPPLPLPAAATLVIFLLGVGALIKWWRKVFANNVYLVLLFVVSAMYVIALMAQGYITYRYTDVLENMNGRYLLPILLLVAAVFAHAINLHFRNQQRRKLALALIIALFFVEGGGLLTFIVRSNSDWYMNNPTVVKANMAAKKVVKHVVIKGKRSYGTHVWFFN